MKSKSKPEPAKKKFQLQTRAYNIGIGWRDYPVPVEAESLEAAVRDFAGDNTPTPPGPAEHICPGLRHEWLIWGSEIEIREKPPEGEDDE